MKSRKFVSNTHLSFPLLAVFISSLATQAAAQAVRPPAGQGERRADGEELITNVYRIADMVLPAPNYSFKGIDIPGLFSGNDATGGGMGAGGFGGGLGGGGLGGGGGGMGGMGGGFHNQPDDLSSAPQAESWLAQYPGSSGYGGGMGGMSGMAMGEGQGETQSFRFTLQDVARVIQMTIQPQSWAELGGQGTIVPLGGNLIITQTAPIHQRIFDLLRMLREESGAIRMITVRAYWLPLNAETMGELVQDDTEKGGGQIDRRQLAILSKAPGSYVGQISCFDGQTVHIVSGRMKTFISTLIPVVGQLDDETEELLSEAAGGRVFHLAQFAGGGGTGGKAAGGGMPGGMGGVPGQMPRDRDVGYQPVMTTIYSGALLQVTPTFVADDSSVVLDLRSIVSEPSEAEDPVTFQGNMSIDRLNVAAQRLMTTVRIATDTPTLVGGLAMRGAVRSEDDREAQEQETPRDAQLYLIVEASLERPAEKPNAKK